MDELKKSIEALHKSVHDFRQENDKEIAELKKKGSADPLLKEKVDKMNTAIDLAVERLEKMETAMNRKAVDTEEKSDTKPEHKSGLNKFLRKGEKFLTDAEVKALSVESDPDGGYLVTPELSSEVSKIVYESSPVRQLASVMAISTDMLEIQYDNDEADGSWVGEQETRSTTDTPVIGMMKIPVHELYANPKATQKLLDDAAVNVEAWLAGKVAEKFARLEATAFISGTGVKQPRGMLTYAAGTSFGQIEQVVSGSSGAFTADGLINLVYALKEQYAANASWLIKRADIKGIRKLKDGNNQYLWGVGLNGGASQALLGHPIYQANDMEAAAANSLSAIFGDIKAAYQIVDRIGIRVLRDPFSSKPFVQFYTTKRVGGDVKNFEAIKIQKLSA